MATKFSKGDLVKVRAVIPSGVVEAIKMDEDGVVSYRFTWTNEDGVEHFRWFEEDMLVAG
jgi:uncharacterized protein YodC (DUF2158 family)